MRKGSDENKRLIRQMERSILEPKDFPNIDLTERVKELTCLYGISQLIAENPDSLETILQRLPNILPPSWQYPVITCARILYDGLEYTSSNFNESDWRQSAAIEIQGNSMGEVEVFYMADMPEADEGPFLNEERLLLNAIAAVISRAAQRIQSAALLRMKQQALEQSHTALKEVLATIEEKQRDIVVNIETNVSTVIMPILYDLENYVVGEGPRIHFNLLKRYLEEITHPFSNSLLKAFTTLSPVEIQVCNMIKNGLSSKAIAKVRRVSPSTVNRQRESIRKKLGIANSKVNLESYLSSYLPK